MTSVAVGAAIAETKFYSRKFYSRKFYSKKFYSSFNIGLGVQFFQTGCLTNLDSIVNILSCVSVFANLNRVFLGEEIHSANIILVLLTGVSLYFLCRSAPSRARWFILLLIGVPFLIFALPDVFLEGGRSLRIRYLIPSYLGIQLALAYAFANQAIWITTWHQKLWRIGLIALITSGIIGCTVISQAQIWWNKGIGRCGYYIPVANLINQSPAPLVIGTQDPMEILGLSDRLDPDVKLQLIRDPQQLEIAEGFDATFLVSPSQSLRNQLKRQDYRLKLLYEEPDTDDVNKDRLWKVQS